MRIDIKSQHSEVHPLWEAIIQRRAAKLTDFCKDIVRLHVTLVHSTHHLRGNEEARLLASVPNETLRVHKAQANMGDAIHSAFSALERELQGWVERRKHRQKREASRRHPQVPA
jgi:ribosomal subunit interface protein